MLLSFKTELKPNNQQITSFRVVKFALIVATIAIKCRSKIDCTNALIVAILKIET